MQSTFSRYVSTLGTIFAGTGNWTATCYQIGSPSIPIILSVMPLLPVVCPHMYATPVQLREKTATAAIYATITAFFAKGSGPEFAIFNLRDLCSTLRLN